MVSGNDSLTYAHVPDTQGLVTQCEVICLLPCVPHLTVALSTLSHTDSLFVFASVKEMRCGDLHYKCIWYSATQAGMYAVSLIHPSNVRAAHPG
jgi:hypothetical protein